MKRVILIGFILAIFFGCGEGKKQPQDVISCIPKCEGKQCGDDGCGGKCGVCSKSESCTPEGLCVSKIPCCEAKTTPGCSANTTIEKCVCAKNPLCCTSAWDNTCVTGVEEYGCGSCCLPQCEGKQCGDDGCGGSCGQCGQGTTCEGNKCVPCSCEGKECGDDGCGNSCGTCQNGKICTPKNTCVNVTPCGVCPEGLTCGADPKNPDWCSSKDCKEVDYVGVCEGDIVLFCDKNTLYSIDCAFLSNGKNTCGYDKKNDYYDCICKPNCTGKICGDDGCGGSCGKCAEGNTCVKGSCVPCTCNGKSCGDDGCGNSCGTCPDGKLCTPKHTCIDATSCGVCAEGLTCGSAKSEKWCSTKGCGGFDIVGECDGEILIFCEDETLYSLDCVFLSDGKYTCGFDQTGNYYNCICKPNCAGKECGDDGCNGSCGDCAEGFFCNESGKCEKCTCEGKFCGDDGCGNSCGTCTSGYYCNFKGQCKQIVISACCTPENKPGCDAEPETQECVCKNDPYCCKTQWDLLCTKEIQEEKCGICCIPNCAGKECGDDGCGGECGFCTDGTYCTENGQCEPCSCLNKQCGEDQCGNSCGTCGEGFFCDYTQKCHKCTCEGKICGDDGCGKSCGTCESGLMCKAGQCVTPTVSECCDILDEPGCSAEPDTEACVCQKDDYCCKKEWDTLCVSEVDEFGCGICCMPDCKGKVCGDDGCGGSCGECSPGLGCSQEGQCIQCICLGGQECGADTCGNPLCGVCPDGKYCTKEGKCAPCGCGFLVCGVGPCGEECGTCSTGYYCDNGQCVPFTGNCCEEKETAGCSDENVAKCVCEKDPYCCNVKWDKSCVAQVKTYNCGTCP